MKKILALLLALMMVVSVVACGGTDKPTVTDPVVTGDSATDPDTDPEDDSGTNFALIVTGFIGETGIEDLIHSGLNQFVAEHGGSVNVIELNYDTSLYENSVSDACRQGEYDIILAGYFDLRESVAKAAEEYPDQKIIIYDSEMDYSSGQYQNVKSLLMRQNEGSFLAGALAALLTTEADVEGINSDKILGWVGAAENPVLNDYLIGYIQGVKYVDPEIEVLYSWVGDFSNTAVAKELALTHFQRGADIVYACASAAGVGVAEAAKEADAYSMDVNVDVAMQMMESNPDVAVHVLTSVEKAFDVLILQTLDLYAADELEWGSTTYGTVASGGVKLSDNEIFRGIVPEHVLDELAEIEKKLVDGEIEVDSAIATSADIVDGWKNW